MTDKPFPTGEPRRIDVLRPTGRRILARGERLFSSGQSVESVFRVVRGRVRLERGLADGRTVAIDTARPGELVAEGSLFGERYHCDAIAETATAVELEERAAFLDRMVAEPRALLHLCEWLGSRLRRARLLLEIRTIRPVRDRLLAYLAMRESPGGPPEERPVRRIADEVGIASETLYRLLAELEAEGEIVRRGRSVRIAGRAPRAAAGDQE